MRRAAPIRWPISGSRPPAHRSRDVSLAVATEGDAGAIAELRAAVAQALTLRHGTGHWSASGTEKEALREIRTSRVILARAGAAIVGTLSLGTRKPWAIAPEHFTPVTRVLYLRDMAVAPAAQGHGVGRLLLAEAERVARAWPADAIRLDAYNGAVGAGAFYAKYGFKEVGRVVYRGTPLIYLELLLA
jgi:GNAT superfamily N-acetyltransferase